MFCIAPGAFIRRNMIFTTLLNCNHPEKRKIFKTSLGKEEKYCFQIQNPFWKPHVADWNKCVISLCCKELTHSHTTTPFDAPWKQDF